MEAVTATGLNDPLVPEQEVIKVFHLNRGRERQAQLRAMDRMWADAQRKRQDLGLPELARLRISQRGRYVYRTSCVEELAKALESPL